MDTLCLKIMTAAKRLKFIFTTLTLIKEFSDF